MLRTAVVALVMTVASYGAGHWLTHDFQVWTAEGARRLEVALQPVPVPAVPMEGPGLAASSMDVWLRQSGRITLVDFVYTRCETVCLSLGGVFQQLQRSLQAARSGSSLAAASHDSTAAHRVQLLSISFDGDYDTPARLAPYATRLGAQPDLWQFVRVPDSRASAELLRRFGVVVVPDGRGNYEHNAAILVLDADARLVRIFDIAEHDMALNYALHLAKVGRDNPGSGAAVTAPISRLASVSAATRPVHAKSPGPVP